LWLSVAGPFPAPPGGVLWLLSSSPPVRLCPRPLQRGRPPPPASCGPPATRPRVGSPSSRPPRRPRRASGSGPRGCACPSRLCRPPRGSPSRAQRRVLPSRRAPPAGRLRSRPPAAASSCAAGWSPCPCSCSRVRGPAPRRRLRRRRPPRPLHPRAPLTLRLSRLRRAGRCPGLLRRRRAFLLVRGLRLVLPRAGARSVVERLVAAAPRPVAPAPRAPDACAAQHKSGRKLRRANA
jgi:hypothetical protein